MAEIIVTDEMVNAYAEKLAKFAPVNDFTGNSIKEFQTITLKIGDEPAPKSYEGTEFGEYTSKEGVTITTSFLKAGSNNLFNRGFLDNCKEFAKLILASDITITREKDTIYVATKDTKKMKKGDSFPVKHYKIIVPKKGETKA